MTSRSMKRVKSLVANNSSVLLRALVLRCLNHNPFIKMNYQNGKRRGKKKRDYRLSMISSISANSTLVQDSADRQMDTHLRSILNGAT